MFQFTFFILFDVYNMNMYIYSSCDKSSCPDFPIVTVQNSLSHRRKLISSAIVHVPSFLTVLKTKVARWQNLIPSFPWIAPPRPPHWHNPRKGRDQILPSGNHADVIYVRAPKAGTSQPPTVIRVEGGPVRQVGLLGQAEERVSDEQGPDM